MFDARSFTVGTASALQVYSQQMGIVLLQIAAPEGASWCGVRFLSADVLLAWTDSKAYAWKLPKGLVDRSSLCTESPDVLWSREIGNGLITTQQAPLLANDPSSGPILVSYDSATLTVLSCLASAQSLCVQHHPWPPAAAEPRSLFALLTEEDEPASLTCSYELDTSVLLGFSNGIIVHVPLLMLIRRVIFDLSSGGGAQLYQGHTESVTCFLYFASAHHGNLFLSGSVDFSVKVWSLERRQLLHTFHQHSGPVSLSVFFFSTLSSRNAQCYTHGSTFWLCCTFLSVQVTRLFLPTKNTSLARRMCVCSIAGDHAMGIMSLDAMKCIHILGGHAFPIETVRWHAAYDFAIVGCTDGTVYVWQLSTDHLDRIATGQVRTCTLTPELTLGLPCNTPFHTFSLADCPRDSRKCRRRRASVATTARRVTANADGWH